MQIEYTNKVTAIWILLTGVFGYATATTSMAGLTILVVLALTPPMILWHFSRKPAATMSESIHNVLR